MNADELADRLARLLSLAAAAAAAGAVLLNGVAAGTVPSKRVVGTGVVGGLGTLALLAPAFARDRRVPGALIAATGFAGFRYALEWSSRSRTVLGGLVIGVLGLVLVWHPELLEE